MGLFKIISKVIEVIYRLDLLLKIKIYLIYYIAMIELVYKTMNYQYTNKTCIKDIKKTNSQLKRYFSIIKQIVNYFIKFNRKGIKNYIGTKREPNIFYKKGTGVLLEITSGNIEKERLKLKELDKGNK